jgi:hypothetical protein
MALYFRLFWAPALASAFLLGLSWAEDDSSARPSLTLLAWFASALALQSFTATNPLWIVGLVAQTLLAVYLILRREANR